MESFFILTPSKNKLEVYINKKVDSNEIPAFTENDILSFLKGNSICFGIRFASLSNLINNPTLSSFPLLIAKGTEPTDGKDGYLKNETMKNKTILDANKILNFREVITIPSVKKGALIATIIPPTNGTIGMDVFGNEIPSKKGKPFKIKKGKNIIVIDQNIYSTIDGQLSVNGTFVDVFPLFEVNGNLDLKVGNIDFIGNVTVNGDIPDGYEVKAGGDIRITGVVEGAILESKGSIYIAGGIVGGNKGKIEAEGNLYAAYINQANIIVGLNIEVSGAILHSKCSAKGQIICEAGSIIGGSISAGKAIMANEIGSRAYTKTELYMGKDQDYISKEKRLQHELQTCIDNLIKLAAYKNKISQRFKTTGKLTTQEIELMKKQQVMQKKLEIVRDKLHQEIDEIHIESEELDSNEIIVHGTIYPNVQMNFGKYCYIIENEQRKYKFSYDHGEIISTAL